MHLAEGEGLKDSSRTPADGAPEATACLSAAQHTHGETLAAVRRVQDVMQERARHLDSVRQQIARAEAAIVSEKVRMKEEMTVWRAKQEQARRDKLRLNDQAFELVERERGMLSARAELERLTEQLVDQQWNANSLEQSLMAAERHANDTADFAAPYKPENRAVVPPEAPAASEGQPWRAPAASECGTEAGARFSGEANAGSGFVAVQADASAASASHGELDEDRHGLLTSCEWPAQARTIDDREAYSNQMRKLRRDARRRAMGEL